MATCRKCHGKLSKRGTCLACRLGPPSGKKKRKKKNDDVGPNGDFVIGCLK